MELIAPLQRRVHDRDEEHICRRVYVAAKILLSNHPDSSHVRRRVRTLDMPREYGLTEESSPLSKSVSKGSPRALRKPEHPDGMHIAQQSF
jgi:hypothetical protein